MMRSFGALNGAAAVGNGAGSVCAAPAATWPPRSRTTAAFCRSFSNLPTRPALG